MSENKTTGQQLFEELSYDKPSVWSNAGNDERASIFSFCEDYKSFLDRSKTEREFVREAEKLARTKGFISIDDIIKSDAQLKQGMKIYRTFKNKTIAFAVVGSESAIEGFNLVGAHIDSPRLDLKPNPLYESEEMAFLKTHYYGGIKKYQWVTIPLSIHGVVVKKDGSTVDITIGEKEDEAVFTITDLLPHLASEQMQKKMSDAITGEGLNILIGSIPYDDKKVTEKVKLNILSLLNEKYGIIEEDFLSAEIEVVPAFKARDLGFDKSMVGAYGQDDRVCSYTALRSILELEDIKKTAVCVLADKEEVGSMGNTGAQSTFLENFIADICAASMDEYNDMVLRRCIVNSKMLSADVNAAIDPGFMEVYDKLNSSYLGKGIALMKYTGSRGKSGSSDASAEFMGLVRNLFNNNRIHWQVAELGKVDKGGGGTIAQFMANMGMDVVDCGVAVLSMHSPFEVTSKSDIYTAYKAYKVFMEKA